MKFNNSHNGITSDDLLSLSDEEAFGNNNFSKELTELGVLIDWVVSDKELVGEVDADLISLIGHSRGGGIVIIKAAEDQRIKKVVGWAPVADFDRYIFNDELEEWRANGVKYWLNSRTGQRMPWFWQMHEDYTENRERFNVLSAAENLRTPLLLFHGTADEAVPLEDSQAIAQQNAQATLKIIGGEGHTFGASHPWETEKLPIGASQVVDQSIQFLKG